MIASSKKKQKCIPYSIQSSYSIYNMKFKFVLLLGFFSSITLCIAQEQPNILWITFEDTSPQFIGAYGNKVVSTPNIDKLASEGILFKNAFSTGTVCSPSRTAIVTGVKTYETGSGNHRSKYSIPDFIKGFPYYLQELGYYTSNNNKTDYNVAKVKEFINETWHESSNKAGWWNRENGQPFFSVFNFMESHQSRVMTGSYDWYKKNVLYQIPETERIADDAFELPPFYADNKPMRKQFARLYNSIKLADIRIGKLLDRLEKEHLRDNTIIFLFADHGEGIPRGKTNGINLGYRVPFIMWFPEKYMHLSPFTGKGKAVANLVDFTDLAPTLINLAGGTPPGYMKGRNMLDKKDKDKEFLFLSSDRSDNGIDMVRTVTDGRWIYSRNYMPFMPEAKYIRYMEMGEIKQQMRLDLTMGKLNEIQKSLFEPRPAEFLFDIENDVWELENLATSSEHHHRLQAMRKALKEHVLQSKDVHFLPEYEIRKLSKTGTAYNYRLDSTNYDLEKVYSAASLSGFKTAEVAKKQIELLVDEDKIVRYWAIMGLKNQPKENILNHKETLVSALHDDYAPVAITTASIIYDHFSDKTAEKKLIHFTQSSNPDLALMAINYILYCENKEPFISTIKSLVAANLKNYDVRAAAIDFLNSLDSITDSEDHGK